MSRCVTLMAVAMLAWLAAASPARALSAAAQDLNDVYALTKDGKIYRIPGGAGAPVLELDLGASEPYNAEWLDFDPGSGQFIVGPGIDGMGDLYKRASPLLTATADIADTGIVGGHGGAVDRFRPATNGKSDLLVADPAPGIVGVVRIVGNGGSANISVAFSVEPQGYAVPEDVEVNYANGEIYVSVQATDSLPGAILRYSNAGAFLEKIDMPGAIDPFCLVYDNTDAVAYYDIVASGFTGTKEIFLVDVDNDRPAGEPRIKLLGPPPAQGAECDDLAISPSGKLLYPDQTGGTLYEINLSNGAATPLANIALVTSCAFVSRNYLASLDSGLAVGEFLRTTGPNGRSAVRVTVRDPEFSSGLVRVEATGTNLAVNGVALPYVAVIDPRHERVKHLFVAEKINGSLGSSIRVIAHDAAGLCGDPELAMVATTKGKGTAEKLDLTGLPQSNKRTLVINNQGVDKIDVTIDRETYKLNGDAKMASGATVDATGKKGVTKIALNGTTTVLVANGSSLTITTQGTGKDAGAEAEIAIY